MRILAKTATYWICHITVAAGLAYALTGDVHAAAAIGLLEPTIQAAVFFIHERIWEKGSRLWKRTGLAPAPAMSVS